MKKLLLMCAFMLFATIAAYAQKTVSGTVTSSEDGSPMPGVTVQVKNSNVGTQTDIEGKFKIEVPADGKTLVFRFVGMTTQEVEIGNQSTMTVSLKPDDKVLSEIVVVGYGEQSRKTLTSSVSTVKGSDLSNLATVSFDQQLAGRAAGVQITQPSGIVGQAPTIRIRGTNSITSGVGPLVVIDNVPMITGNQSGVTPTNPLGDINPSDIESYEVLKDGAATAIYGSRGANGVILITTKRGKKGSATKVNFDMYTGVTNAIKRFDLLKAADFIAISNEKFTNLARIANPNAAAVVVANPGGVDTDWQKQVLQQGVIQNYALNFSGGVDKTAYFASIGYNTIKSPIVANGQERLNFRGSMDHQFNKLLEAGVSFGFTRTTNTGLNTGTNALSGNMAGALRMLPNVPVMRESDPTGFNLDSLNPAVLGRWSNVAPVDNNYTNIAFVLANNQYKTATNRVLSNVYFKFNVPSVEGLSIRTQYAVDFLSLRDYQSLDPRHGDGRGLNGLVFQRSREVYRWNWQNTLNYNRTFGDHNLSFVAGLEYQGQTTSRFDAQGQNFSDRFFQQNGLIDGGYATQVSGGDFVPTGFDSRFARINYGFKDKYLIGFTIRNDGISALPKDNRLGTFMGGSFGYRISEESFYQNSGIAKIMNEFKIRASYGQVGNVDIGSFPYAGLFGTAQYASQNGISYGQAGNSSLKWESSAKTDIGIELAFLDSRITANIDYFRNDVTGLILFAPTPSSLGLPGNGINKNVGSLTNTGIELQLGAEIVRSKDFKWSVDVNATFIKNNITALNKGTDGKDQDIIGTYNIVRVGESIGSLYGIQSAGVNPANGFPLVEKGDGRIVQRNPSTGAYGFYTPENQAFVANAAATLNFNDVSLGGDRRVLGSSIPKWFGGFNNRFSYKGLDMEVFLRFSGGNKIMNVTRQTSLLSQDFTNNGKEILNRWTAAGQETDVPMIVARRGNIINFDGNAISRFVESGNFLRVQNIVLGYTLPASILDKTQGKSFPVRSLRVYLQIQNALTFSKYKGLDPELNTGTGAANQGVDFNTNPQMRTFTVGLNIGL